MAVRTPTSRSFPTPRGSIAASGELTPLLDAPPTGKGLSGAGAVLLVAGAINEAIGAYYTTQANIGRSRQDRLNLEFQGSIADLNARIAEQDAQAALAAGQHEAMLASLRFAAVRGSQRARQGASGLQIGVGSAAEVDASIEAAREMDLLTIERNTLRAAGAARMRAVDQRNRAEMARVAAQNLGDLESTFNPGLSAFTSLLGSAGPTIAGLA